ncbi:mitochondrial 2-oxodicarboxylate carrier [Gadus chalcogrammus]|uniref:mitochondrial 2-oxodicarboxylate carrier n=1 Tax=Gadus chalcogrammus TaxID=1042646 RepID=UPI0024C35068|nr:mitochondrial 2-oxodicarboxylate carrier [Gadus chalcogrammus]
MTTTKPRSLAREASHQIIAGGSAGDSSTFTSSVSSSSVSSYFISSCTISSLEEQPGTAQLKGWGWWPGRSGRLNCNPWRRHTADSDDASQEALSVAGLGSGLTEAIVVNPFEVVKVSLQANRDSFKEQPSSFGQARRIINADGFGLRGLNKGLTSTLGRHGVFNMIYFGFYFNVKDAIPASQDPTLEFMRKFAIGLTSGTISSCVNIPFDVAKSRIQGPQPVPGEIKYRTCFQSMGLVYREEGYLALYKGLVPKIMRLGPGGAVMLLVYEYVSGWLQENW